MMQAALKRPPHLSDGVVRGAPLDARFIPDFDALTADPDVLRFTRVPSNRDDGFAAAWVGQYTEGWEDGSRAGFAILDEADGAFLGFAALIRIDWSGAEAELGYIVAPAARGRGVAGRAIRLIVGWALDELGLQRIDAWIDVANAPSLRVIERAGFTFEGVRRSVSFKGVRRDMAIYSLLPSDPPPVIATS
jgi:RimJ/RimL family protein N-acetyltransferase